MKGAGGEGWSKLYRSIDLLSNPRSPLATAATMAWRRPGDVQRSKGDGSAFRRTRVCSPERGVIVGLCQRLATSGRTGPASRCGRGSDKHARMYSVMGIDRVMVPEFHL